MSTWQFWVDRGGTFTDIIGVQPDGLITVKKLLSDNPAHYQDAVSEGIHQIIASSDFRDSPIDAIKMGTTVATNALLTHSGAKTALLITKGFKDLFLIGTQQRADLFALHIKKSMPLYDDVIEVDERMGASGDIVNPLNVEKIESSIHALKKKGIESIAIVLLHADKNPLHEKRLLKLCEGFDYVIASHEVGATENALRRGGTTLLDAYLSPVLIRYIQTLKDQFHQTPLYFMQSQGGLVESQRFYGRHSILSGPAGGVVGAVQCALNASIEKVIGFDMGGTSTDVFHYRGDFEKTFDSDIAGVGINIPMLDIHTIAAGGGSKLDYLDGRMQVGPESAGSHPGPACYRGGGPLTITDANFLLGKLQPSCFPHCFGPSQDEGPSLETVKHHFIELRDKINQSQQSNFTTEDIAAGFIDIAVESMSQAIKSISFERGHNINDYALFSFGGASGQHACLIAERLGVEKVILHPLSSVLSAYGMGAAKLSSLEQSSVSARLSQNAINDLSSLITSLKQKAKETLMAYHGFHEHIDYTVTLRLKTEGSNTALVCQYHDEIEVVYDAYQKQFIQSYGFFDEDKAIEIETIMVEGHRAPFTLSKERSNVENKHQIKAEAIRIYTKGQFHEAPCYDANQLKQDKQIQGPALIIYPNTTFVVEPGWSVSLDAQDCLIATQQEKNKPYHGMTNLNPILLEIFNKSFMHIATQMGYVLANTASSVNIKERRDYSCALFDKSGGLIANAPHMPVHLGSMGESVKAVIQRFKNIMQEGDSYILNDPYQGGTHLPDITVITPFFVKGECLFFLGSRGHHADIGGKAPGSIPSFSEHIDEEGVLIEPQKLIHKNTFLEDEIVNLLTHSGARNIPQNIGDLKAQCAANQKGIQGFKQLIDTYSLETVLSYTGYIQDNAALAVKHIILSLQEGACRYPMDNGAIIEVSVSKERDQLVIDFTGTSSEQDNNFNAPYAITKAAVLYVLRTLVKHDIPLNEGCLEDVKLIVPEHSMLNPTFPHAVVAGNVETSQAIVNALYLALGVMAGAQGTMNNLTLGTDDYQYYETICGGSGAGLDFNGSDAVHTHMTNSLLTDVEVLESRYPIRVETFSIREGSGGQGEMHGGEGVKRHLLFLSPMMLNMVSGHRQIPPPGLNKGEPGQVGRNILFKSKGEKNILNGSFSLNVEAGDSLLIETPGGGGATK